MNATYLPIAIAAFLCPPFAMGQAEPQQFLLQKMGDRFELWQSGLGNSGRDLFTYDSEMRAGDRPSIRISSSGDTAGGVLRLQMPIQIQPFTEYQIRYKVRTGRPGGAEVRLAVGLCDESREERVSIPHALATARDEGIWADGAFRFQTAREHRFLQVQLTVPPKFSGTMWLGGIYVEQAGLPGALRPGGVPIFEQLGFSLKGPPARPWASDLKAVPAGNTVATLSFDLLYHDISGEAWVAIDWLATTEPGSVVARDRCVVDRIEGIEGPWNSARTQWFRKTGGPLDAVSYQLDLYPDTAPKSGHAGIAKDLPIPARARYVRISLVPEGRFRGTIEIRKLRLRAAPN